MLKLLGALMLLSGGILFGVSAVGKLSGRVKQLYSITSALTLLEWELGYNLASVNHLLLKTAEKSEDPAAAFLKECAKGIAKQEGQALSRIWNQAAKTTFTCLDEYDLREIFSVGAVLGRYDADSQKQSLRCARENLIHQMQEAADNRKNLSKVYGAIGVAGGAFLALILL